MNDSPGPLYMVMVDHASTNTSGSEGTFYINPDDASPTFTSSELAGWLTTLQGNTPTNTDPIISMIGACFSGSWIDDLAVLVLEKE